MVVLRQRTPQVFPQFVVILYYQYFLAVTGILSLLLGMFVTLYGRVDGRGVRSALFRRGDLFRFIVLFLLFGGSRTVYGLAVAFLAFRERYFDAGAFSFGAGEVELSFMHMHEFPYKKQSDAAAGYFGIDGIAAAEVHLEQLFLLVQWNADTRVTDFHVPGIFRFVSIDMHASAFGRVFQCIGYDILQNGVHLILIQPDIQIAEVAFVSQVDVLYGSV